MAATPVRRFTIVDGMVLVAATAIGCASLRGVSSDDILLPPDAAKSSLSVFILIWNYIKVFLPTAFSWTVALAILRQRRPRLSYRRLTVRPGAVACLAVSAVGAVRLLGWLGWFGTFLYYRSRGGYAWGLLEDEFEPSSFIYEELGSLSAEASLAVAAVWMTLLLGRRWRPEPSWIDRSGRLLGAFWIGIIPFSSWVGHYVSPALF